MKMIVYCLWENDQFSKVFNVWEDVFEGTYVAQNCGNRLEKFY